MEQQEDLPALASEIAGTLQEPNVILVAKMLSILGPERVQSHATAALAVQAAGGMPTANGKRQRTLGGVFCRLVKEACTPEERKAIFPPPNKKRKQRGEGSPQAKAPKGPPPVAPPWADVEAALNGLERSEKGKTNVKMTLIGRPVKTAQIGDAMLCQMVGAGPGELPKGVPVPPGAGATQSYAVFVALPAWKKVQTALADPEDALIVEGWPYMDTARGLFVVLAKSVTTKNLQRAKREKKAA